VCDTLKEKRSGYSAKSRDRMVLLPEPLGPDMTMGGLARRASQFEVEGALDVEPTAGLMAALAHSKTLE
jgi:hypothetical protein